MHEHLQHQAKIVRYTVKYVLTMHLDIIHVNVFFINLVKVQKFNLIQNKNDLQTVS